MRDSTLDQVREFGNEQLKTLLKEVKEMGKLRAPASFKQSKQMKQLFKLEKSVNHYWMEQFRNVQTAIEYEILLRVRTDAW